MTEIILIIVGFVAVILGFVLPAGRGGEVDPEEIEEMVQDKLDRSLNDSVRRQIEGMAVDAVSDAIDDNKLALSRISNEKVMEISEYAGTVLDDIKKNHDEVVFMYDMLNDKHRNLTNTVTEITRTAETAKQTVRDAELTARDAKDAAATLDAAAARAKLAAEVAKSERTEFTAPDPHSAESAPVMQEESAAPVETPPVADEPEAKDGMFTYTPQNHTDPAAQLMDAVSTAEEAAPPQPEERHINTPNVARATPRRAAGTEPMTQNRQILEMHNAGKSNMVIARELGLGIGEVRLVIDLSRKQGKVKESGSLK